MRHLLIGILLCTIFTTNAMEQNHHYKNCTEQALFKGCSDCCSQYQESWKKYADNFANSIEDIKAVSTLERPFRTNKIGETLLQVFSQKDRSDRILYQLMVIELVPYGDNMEAFDNAKSLKTLKSLFSSKIIGGKTFSHALKIRAYRKCTQSLSALGKYYLKNGLENNDQRLCKKAKLCNDIAIKIGAEKGALHNCYLSWALGNKKIAREYLSNSPKNLHKVLPLLKLLKNLCIKQQESLAKLILSAYCSRLLNIRCIVCNAGLCGFYQAVNSYFIPVSENLRAMIEPLIGSDQKFIRNQGVAALSAQTLIANIKDKTEQNNTVVCPYTLNTK